MNTGGWGVVERRDSTPSYSFSPCPRENIGRTTANLFNWRLFSLGSFHLPFLAGHIRDDLSENHDRFIDFAYPTIAPSLDPLDTSDTMTYESTRKLYEDSGQGHLFKFWSSLSPSEQSSLLDQLDSIDIKRVNRIHAKALEVEKATNEGTTSEIIEPLPEGASSSTNDPDAESQWKQLGLRKIAEGEVGVLLMAGGQGTRLGSSAPKGCYDIGLPSHKSLFQYQAERITGLQTVAETECGKEKGSVIIPWYVMTSGPTRPDTEKFFVENSYFGLDPSNVIFFEQGS